MNAQRSIIVGGGAAGFFAAIACARARPEREVVLLEKTSQLLAKVRISGGGRCNVTHACFDPRALAARYPRGGRALIGPFTRFQASDTVEWFQSRGVALKTESDGRMFPVTDSSQTIIDRLESEATAAGVKIRLKCGVERIERSEGGNFRLTLTDGGTIDCDRLLLATGGSRTSGAIALAESLGHRIEPPVPSLFTFQIDVPWLRKLPGLAVEDAEVSIPGTRLKERGPVLVTHWGLSGPAILRLSAHGARLLHDRNYKFDLWLHWLPGKSAEEVDAALQAQRAANPNQLVVNGPLAPLPSRLWEQLCATAQITDETRWAQLSRVERIALVRLLTGTELPVTGKSLNKEEFVTCGGVRLREVDFKTMESKLVPGLYFAGEVLDIDGLTGGFNFQAAWTTAWIAAQGMSV